MKLFSKKLSLVVASAAVVLAGCTKQPTRPSPSETLVGPRPGGADMGGSTAPVNLSTVTDLGLAARGDGFDPLGQNREILKAQAVLFDFDQFSIKASEREKLKAAKDHLDKNPTHRLLLEGHCDWRGTAEYNLSLGDRRANATKKYLVSIGVAADKLDTLSKGSLEAAKNADEATMAKDRRVELVVVDPAKSKPAAL